MGTEDNTSTNETIYVRYHYGIQGILQAVLRGFTQPARNLRHKRGGELAARGASPTTRKKGTPNDFLVALVLETMGFHERDQLA